MEPGAELQPRRHWQAEITAFRGTLQRRLKRSPSVTHALDLAARYDEARRIAAKLIPEEHLPSTCPYTLTELRDHDFLPPSRLTVSG